MTQTVRLFMGPTDVIPPMVMTMEEFRRDWEPQGWQLLVIGPTATWRTEWGEWEAIRDIVQNALDETEAYTWGYDDHGLWIHDEGRGMAIEHFLLGPSRLKSDYARGRYGEGMKIAALALLRKGYKVKVETVGKVLWLIFMQTKLDSMAEQLAAIWRPQTGFTGTTFHIVGYHGSAFADYFAINIPRTQILHQGPSPILSPIPRMNQIIGSPAGRIYARDIFMREIRSPFSYNLWGFELAPDRHGPKDESKMWVDVGRTWATVSDVGLLQRFLAMVQKSPEILTDEANHITMGNWEMGQEPISKKTYWNIMRDNQEKWREAWQRQMGKDAVLRTSSNLDGTVNHLGYRSVSVVWSVEAALGQVLVRDIDLIKASQMRLREAKVIPDEDLTAVQRAHLRLARAIANSFKLVPIAGVHAAIIPPASDRMRTAGLYNTETKEIFIDAAQLSEGNTMVKTLIHEIAHHTSGADDMTPQHNEAMTEVAAWVVRHVAHGTFDELLKEVEW